MNLNEKDEFIQLWRIIIFYNAFDVVNLKIIISTKSTHFIGPREIEI